MNYILAILFITAFYVGLVVFKRGKEQVDEVEPAQPETDRHSAKKLMKAAKMQLFWSSQCAKIYKENGYER